MNNEELKKKILSIVRGAMLEADELPFIETTDNIADALIAAGIGDVKEAEYRKATDVIDEFVERVNLIECEMFHKAHDSRNYYEYEINNGNTEDRVWGGKRECDGKMIALQDFMTKIEKLADEARLAELKGETNET